MHFLPDEESLAGLRSNGDVHVLKSPLEYPEVRSGWSQQSDVTRTAGNQFVVCTHRESPDQFVAKLGYCLRFKFAPLIHLVLRAFCADRDASDRGRFFTSRLDGRDQRFIPDCAQRSSKALIDEIEDRSPRAEVICN